MVGSVDQVVYPFQGKCHVNMLGSTSLVIYFPASDTVAQTNLLDSRFRDAFKNYLADFSFKGGGVPPNSVKEKIR